MIVVCRLWFVYRLLLFDGCSVLCVVCILCCVVGVVCLFARCCLLLASLAAVCCLLFANCRSSLRAVRC